MVGVDTDMKIPANPKDEFRPVLENLAGVLEAVADEIHRNEWLDDLWITAEAGDSRPHRGQIDQQRHASKILQQNAGDDERNL